VFRFPLDQLWGGAVAQIFLVLEKRA